MVKKCIFALLTFTLLFGAVACGPAKAPLTSPPAEAAKALFYEAHLDAPVEDVDVLSVEMTDTEHAIVDVRVTFGQGMAHMPPEENYRVFLVKYGDEWEVLFTQ